MFLKIHLKRMKKLNLSHLLFLKAKKGLKTASTRKGIKEFTLGFTQCVDIKTKETIDIRITKLELRKYKQIDDKLANIEDYSRAEDLKFALKSYYPNIKEDDDITIVFFTLV